MDSIIISIKELTIAVNNHSLERQILHDDLEVSKNDRKEIWNKIDNHHEQLKDINDVITQISIEHPINHKESKVNFHIRK